MSLIPPPRLSYLQAPNFSAFRPKNNHSAVQSVAWSCDGRRLATCGIERVVRLWSPEKNVSAQNGARLMDFWGRELIMAR